MGEIKTKVVDEVLIQWCIAVTRKVLELVVLGLYLLLCGQDSEAFWISSSTTATVSLSSWRTRRASPTTTHHTFQGPARGATNQTAAANGPGQQSITQGAGGDDTMAGSQGESAGDVSTETPERDFVTTQNDVALENRMQAIMDAESDAAGQESSFEPTEDVS